MLIRINNKKKMFNKNKINNKMMLKININNGKKE